MDAKLEISGKTVKESPTAATYKPIPEGDMEEEAVANRPKSLAKLKTGSEPDGADERMLPKEESKIVPNSKIENCDVKISPISEKNGDAKLDIGEVKQAFVGMTKEELMKFANDPFWVRLRWFMFITFWLLWAAMLVGAVLIIYAAPKCDPPPPRTWWQEGPLTEIPADTNPEQLTIDNSIKGVIVSLPEDVYADKPLDNVSKLMIKTKEKDIKVIIEVDPTASNNWFEKSESKTNNFTDYYIWRPPSSSVDTPKPPNNWLNLNNESSWKYSEKRKEFYYAPFGKPHLNFRNNLVVNEFSNIIKKLLDLGASGIRLKNAAYLLVSSAFEDEMIKPGVSGLTHLSYGFYTHTKTQNLPELGTLLKQWRSVVRNKTNDGPFMVAEELTSINAYKVNETLVVDLPLQSQVFSKSVLTVNETVHTLYHLFDVDNVEWPLWKATSPAVPKDALDIVTYLLPGVPLVNSSEPVNQHLLKLRDSPAIMRGTCNVQGVANNTVLTFVREKPGNPGVLVALNTFDERVIVNFPAEVELLNEVTEVTVHLYSQNYNETEFLDVTGKKDASTVPLSPKSAIVLTYVPKHTE